MNKVNALREETAAQIIADHNAHNIDTQTASELLQELDYGFEYIWNALIVDAPEVVS